MILQIPPNEQHRRSIPPRVDSGSIPRWRNFHVGSKESSYRFGRYHFLLLSQSCFHTTRLLVRYTTTAEKRFADANSKIMGDDDQQQGKGGRPTAAPVKRKKATGDGDEAGVVVSPPGPSSTKRRKTTTSSTAAADEDDWSATEEEEEEEEDEEADSGGVVASLKAEVKDLKSDLASVRSIVSSLSSTVAALSSTVASLTSNNKKKNNIHSSSSRETSTADSPTPKLRGLRKSVEHRVDKRNRNIEGVGEYDITEVNENDVLCGRGRKTKEHTGNMKFLAMIKRELPNYEKGERTEKKAICQHIVDNIWGKKGRFLEKKETDGDVKDEGGGAGKKKEVKNDNGNISYYRELTQSGTMEKVSQAFRSQRKVELKKSIEAEAEADV